MPVAVASEASRFDVAFGENVSSDAVRAAILDSLRDIEPDLEARLFAKAGLLTAIVQSPFFFFSEQLLMPCGIHHRVGLLKEQ